MIKRIGFKICALFVMLLCAGVFVYGQADRATITGTVTDQSGAVMPGVRVVAINTDTRTTFKASTNETGIYIIPNLPVGTYGVEMSQTGFKTHQQSGVMLIASQVLKLDVLMTVGSTAESITVAGTPPLDMETSSVAMTMEQSAIRDLPLNAQNGRDALGLMVATVPAMSGTIASTGTQDWLNIAGGATMTNLVFVDGIEATAGNQGSIPTPGLDALQEMQVASIGSAELGGGGASILYELKSGTNKFHGSAFEYLQNTALNANNWADNFFLARCAPSDTSCVQDYKKPMYRFNDYGGSAGGPIWKNHTFIFGDYEHYAETDKTLNPVGMTVPTAKMLTGDFSELLTMGTNTGPITNPATGSAWINPCTGSAYQYGQIFNPATQTQVGGVTCATPFPGNIIPGNLISNQAKQVAGIYSK